MGSKAEILAAIRGQQVPPTELPSLDQAWIRYDDPLAQFKALVESVGGRCFVVDRAEANRVLEETPAYKSAQQVVSLVPGIGRGNIDLASIDDPHELETIDYAILPGHFAVAENGAIWVTDEGVKHRAIYFICQHLALVISRDAVLHNMHEAYERLAFSDPGYGAFISGPSKTADIEQSLVIGAHGPRSMTALVLSENHEGANHESAARRR
jgi:L-lactate dehydrogenase complex protein LldG